MKKKTLLMVPGVTNIPDKIIKEFGKQPIPHRSNEFSDILKKIYQNLKYVFQTKNDVFILTSSGTGAMCSALENLINPGDKVLSLVIGVFGERWVQIAQSKGAVVETIKVNPGEVIDPKILEQKLNEDTDIKLVTLTHSETSTGAANDIKMLCKIIKKHGALSIVDGISSVGIMECKTDDWGIDVIVASSQKGFMIPPGLAFLCVSNKAYEISKKCKYPPFYFNWHKYKLALEYNTVPFTPAINNILALNKSLEIIKQKGLENIIAQHEKQSKILRNELENMGLKLVTTNSKNSSYAVCAAYAPKNISVQKIIKQMKKKYNIFIANGQDTLKDKIFRIGIIGCDEKDIKRTVNALKKIITA